MQNYYLQTRNRLVYEIKDGNVSDQCFKDKHLFDFSGFPKDSVYYDISNKKNTRKNER